MGTTETIRIEGVVRAGERVEVELRVGGETVARGARGDRLTVGVSDGDVEVDVSALSLAASPPEEHRASWRELERRPEAGLVADRSPAPHEAATLVVRRIAVADAVALEAVPTDETFDPGSTHRQPASRRVRRVRALALSRPSERPIRAPARQTRWWLAIPWGLAALVALANAAAAWPAGALGPALVSAAGAASVFVAARFVHRALVAPPVMDHGVAHPFLRFFARGARSLPRFAPGARDASRRLIPTLGPPVVVAWAYLAFLAVVWPVGVLSGEIRPEHLSTDGVRLMNGLQALALAVLATGYLAADASELGKVRSLLDALRGGRWRARLGVVAGGPAEDLLERGVFVEGDHTHAEDATFYSRTDEGGVEALEVRTDAGVVTAPRASLAWASADWTSTRQTARMRVREGAAVIVAGFDDGGTLVGRGPASMMLFATPEGRPDERLRAGLRARLVDAAVAAVLALPSLAAVAFAQLA